MYRIPRFRRQLAAVRVGVSSGSRVREVHFLPSLQYTHTHTLGIASNKSDKNHALVTPSSKAHLSQSIPDRVIGFSA